MTSPASTPTRHWGSDPRRPPPRDARRGRPRHRSSRGAATGQLHADSPVDPLGPGFLLDRGEFYHHRPSRRRPGDRALRHQQPRPDRRRLRHRRLRRPRVRPRPRALHDHRCPASRTLALRINARGQVLGDYEDARRLPRLPAGQGPLHDDRRPGAPTCALGLNDRGQVVGHLHRCRRSVSRVPPRQGVYTTIDVPGALQSTAVDINARGQTIGFYLDAGTTRVYRRAANGRLTMLAFPGAVATVPFGINNRGHVVGFSWMPTRSATASCSRTTPTRRSIIRWPPPTLRPTTSTTAARSSACTSVAARRSRDVRVPVEAERPDPR